jgi:hypothetical protein
MKEEEIIKKIQCLKEIKPAKEWVKETRIQILGQREKFWPVYTFNFAKKPAFVFTVLILILITGALIGLLRSSNFQFLTSPILEIVSQNNYDYNYYLEKAERNLEKIFSNPSEEEKKVVIEDTAQAIKKAVQNLPLRPSNPEESAKIVEKVKSIEKKLASLGPEAKEISKETANLKEKTKEMIENEIYRIRVETELAMLEKRLLNNEQKELLNEAKKAYKQGEYLKALEKILQLTNQ